MAVKRLLALAMVISSGILLLCYGHAANDGTLPREATVPTTQSTVGMDSEAESSEESEGLFAPTLDMSNSAHRQRLLANFDREREILKRRGLSDDEIEELKGAIINGDEEEIKRVYNKKMRDNGGKQ